VTLCLSQLQEVFRHRPGERLSLGQIRQLMSHDSDITIRTDDLIEAIREIIASSESGDSSGGGGGGIQFMENTQTVLIRSGRRG
jgi:hypothetical protein